MSDLHKENLKFLSQLCRIQLTEEESAALYTDLKKILDYADQLQEVDVSDLSPYSHMEEQGIGSLREDVIGEILPRETFLANSPDQVGGMIRVPPIIKQA